MVNCSECPDPSAAICAACQSHYCLRHFVNHKEIFENLINNARQQPASIVHCLDKYEQTENDLRDQIQKWEEKTIEHIRQIAMKANSKLENLIKDYRVDFQENSIGILEDARKTPQVQMIEIENLQHHYENTLKNIRFLSHHNREPTLEIKIIDPKNEDKTLTDMLFNESSQADIFIPQTSLGKRLMGKPFAQNSIGNYWAIGGSDMHLLVQDYERNELILFDRNGKKTISMTWHFKEAVS